MKSLATRRGAILIMAAGLMLLLLGLVTFGVDIGSLVTSRNQLQNGMDAAALSGARALPNRTQAVQSAIDYAGRHATHPNTSIHLLPGQVEVGVWDGVAVTAHPTQANAVHVNSEEQLPTFFARVFGQNTMRIQQQATAVKDSPLTHIILDIRADMGEYSSQCTGVWQNVDEMWDPPDCNTVHPPIPVSVRKCLDGQCVADCGGDLTCMAACPAAMGSELQKCQSCVTVNELKPTVRTSLTRFENVALPKKQIGVMPFSSYGLIALTPLRLTQDFSRARREVESMGPAESQKPEEASFADVIKGLNDEMRTVDGGRNSLVVYNATMGGPADCALAKTRADEARQLGVQVHIFAVGPNNLTDLRAGHANLVCLKEIAERTGGQFRHEPNINRAVDEVREIVDQAVEDLPVRLTQ